MKSLGRILILGNYNSSKNVYLSEIETFIALHQKGFDITIMGDASAEITQHFTQHDIDFIQQFPTNKFDKLFAKKVQEIVNNKQIQILYVRNGKFLRSFLPFYKKENTKIVTYYGSSSLHWHDPMAYLSYLNPKVDKIVCNSRYVYQHVQKQLFGKAKKKAIKIYKGYKISWFENIEPFDYGQLNIPKNAIKVIMVARNDKVKDIPTFLQTAKHFQENPRIHFILVGKQLTANHLKIRQENNLHLLGFRKDAPSLIKGADIYIQTSVSEGLGRGISEAISMRKPIIMTNAGGCTELIDEQKGGFVVDVQDHLAMANKIKYLIENPVQRKKMGEKAAQKIQEDLSLAKTIEGFSQLFKKLLK